MVPIQYIETVALGDAAPYVEESCVSYCDLEAENRCKTGVTIGPGLVPKSYRDSIIVYLDSTRKKYISRVEYTTKMKPKSYSETNYMRPRALCRTFASMVDYHAEGSRKWYKTTVQLKPKVYSSSQEVNIGDEQKRSEMADVNNATFDSMGYASDDNSLGDPLSPLRLKEGQSSPLDDYRRWSKDSSPRSRRAKDNFEEEEINGNVDYRHMKSRDSGYGASDIYESHWDPDAVTIHRSGPFIYNAPKERRRRYVDTLEDDMEENGQEVLEDKLMMNGDLVNGHGGEHYPDPAPRINGYSNHQHSDSEEDLVDL